MVRSCPLPENSCGKLPITAELDKTKGRTRHR
ncbi:hypothetical protein PENARI_c333G11526, partial [Penicillium arizonense]